MDEEGKGGGNGGAEVVGNVGVTGGNLVLDVGGGRGGATGGRFRSDGGPGTGLRDGDVFILVIFTGAETLR